MVDDNEFIKRRHLSRGRPRKYELGSMNPTDPPTGEPPLTQSPKQKSLGQSSTLSEQNRSHKKSGRGSKRKSLSGRQQSHPYDMGVNHDHQPNELPQQQPQQKQQQQRCPGDSFHGNPLNSEHLVLPPFGMAALSKLPSSVHPYNQHPYPGGGRFLNPNSGQMRTEFDLGMSFYQDMNNGVIDC